MICRYTEITHIIIAKIKDTVKHIFSALFSFSFEFNIALSKPPPSNIEIGYKFIRANDKFNTIKVERVSFFPTFNKKQISADNKLKAMPPIQTSASFL